MKLSYSWADRCGLCKQPFSDQDIIRPIYGQKYSAADDSIRYYVAHPACKMVWNARVGVTSETASTASGRKRRLTRKGWKQV